MRKYSVTYSETTHHERLFNAVTVDVALNLAREILGDVEITHVSVEDGEACVQYAETVSKEAVISANSEQEAKTKVNEFNGEGEDSVEDCWILNGTGVGAIDSPRVILTEDKSPACDDYDPTLNG